MTCTRLTDCPLLASKRHRTWHFSPESFLVERKARNARKKARQAHAAVRWGKHQSWCDRADQWNATAKKHARRWRVRTEAVYGERRFDAQARKAFQTAMYTRRWILREWAK